MSSQQPHKQISKLDSIQIQSPNRMTQSAQSHKKSKPPQTKIMQPIKQLTQKKQHQHIAPALYEETYYLTSLRENYLVLISDSMHIIQLPVGLLNQNVTIGDPIKLKLQFDVKRAQSDRKKFINLQQDLIKQLSQD